LLVWVCGLGLYSVQHWAMQSVRQLEQLGSLWVQQMASQSELQKVLHSVRHWAPRWEWQTVPQMGPQ